MTALLSVYDSEQGCVGTCGKKCYAAKSAKCGCICAGANHGVGFYQAVKNVIERDIGLRCDDVTNYANYRHIDVSDRPLVVVNRLKVQHYETAARHAKKMLAPLEPLPLLDRMAS
jgi:hypothetical protein